MASVLQTEAYGIEWSLRSYAINPCGFQGADFLLGSSFESPHIRNRSQVQSFPLPLFSSSFSCAPKACPFPHAPLPCVQQHSSVTRAFPPRVKTRQTGHDSAVRLIRILPREIVIDIVNSPVLSLPVRIARQSVQSPSSFENCSPAFRSPVAFPDSERQSSRKFRVTSRNSFPSCSYNHFRPFRLLSPFTATLTRTPRGTASVRSNQFPPGNLSHRPAARPRNHSRTASCPWPAPVRILPSPITARHSPASSYLFFPRQLSQSASVTSSIAFAALCSQRTFLLARSRRIAGITLGLPR